MYMLLKISQSFLLVFCLSIVHASGDDNIFDKSSNHSSRYVSLGSFAANISGAVLLHDHRLNTPICYYSMVRAGLLTTNALITSFQNYLPSDIEDWLVKHSFLSKKNPDAIEKNTAILFMQTVRTVCYMQASKILSQETCTGTQGNFSLACTYLVVAGLMDLSDFLR